MEIKNEKYETYLKTIADGSIDLVCIDPPYTDNKGNDVLKGHKIQTKIDISHVVSEAFRVAKDNSFFVVFGKMPSVVDWHIETIKAGFVFDTDIIWSKRSHSLTPKLLRKHELIYLYKKGNPKYYNDRIDYADYVVPAIMHQDLKIDSVMRELSYWKSLAKGNKPKAECNYSKQKNDKIYQTEKEYTCTKFGVEKVKISTIWSFMPENKKGFGAKSENTKHPSVKSIKLLERLIELCTPEPTKENKPIVLDYFLGSGTTAIAAVNTNRDFKGCEMDKIYYDTEIIPRVNKAIQNHNSDMFKSAEFGVLSCL